MDWKRAWAAWMVCLLVVVCAVVPRDAQALGTSTVVTPRYTYTESVNATLTISSSGVANCSGYIVIDDTTSDIQMRVNLYRKEGNVWYKEVGWTASCEGELKLYIGRTYTVTPGTYKVVTTGAILGADGGYETVSCESPVSVYP